jgi:hypothetical protein
MSVAIGQRSPYPGWEVGHGLGLVAADARPPARASASRVDVAAGEHHADALAGEAARPIAHGRRQGRRGRTLGQLVQRSPGKQRIASWISRSETRYQSRRAVRAQHRERRLHRHAHRQSVRHRVHCRERMVARRCARRGASPGRSPPAPPITRVAGLSPEYDRHGRRQPPAPTGTNTVSKGSDACASISSATRAVSRPSPSGSRAGCTSRAPLRAACALGAIMAASKSWPCFDHAARRRAVIASFFSGLLPSGT